jgi:hypothetical protein
MAYFSLASLFQIGLLLIFICWTTESSGAAFSLEEEFKQLKVKLSKNSNFIFTLILKFFNNHSLLLFNFNLRIDSNERNCQEF